MKLKKIAALLTVAGLASPAFATNGMNLEGYGPVATGMGGASMAYDNGNAGLINNPATLTLIKSGTSRFAVAIGNLNPNIDSSMPGTSKHSDGSGYYMPAVGYTRKDGIVTWGVGMMAQGGMGTEYGTSSFISGYSSMIGTTSGGSGQEARTELGIGRILFPLGFDVTENFNIAGTFDYLWGGMDMRQPMSGSLLSGMVASGVVGGSMITGLFGVFNNNAPGGSCTGAGIPALGGACINDVDYMAIDVSEGTNKMKQKATTTGTAFNVGFTWKATPQLAVGGVYHAKTNLKDMTGSGKVNMQVKVGPNTGAASLGTGGLSQMSVSGNYKIIDFQWPETYGIGISYQANSQWQIVADYKLIKWSETMKTFRLQFIATDGMFAGSAMNMASPMNWVDQDVFQIGASYKMSDAMTLRFGANIANDPVNSQFMNPLFPAIITHQYTAGLGYAVSKDSNVDFSVTMAPENSVKNASNITTSHSQVNWQAMFTRRF
ncbi:MAG: outer membrane protein transport protein [Sulfurisoma sp.]|nr:outer membrane protein transport protein [Sulfurisoma sp.]